jgi:hypothetical protein
VDKAEGERVVRDPLMRYDAGKTSVVAATAKEVMLFDS